MSKPANRMTGLITPRIPTPLPSFCIGCGAVAILVLTIWRMLP